MHIIYLDDSGDDKYWVISALALPIGKWHECLATLKSFRRTLRETYGIPIHKELHAWKFVSGRGDISAKIITRTERSLIFRQLQKTTATLPGARLFNAIAPRSREKDTLGWLLNRINRTLTAWDSYGILVCDEGHEIEYTRLSQKDVHLQSNSEPIWELDG